MIFILLMHRTYFSLLFVFLICLSCKKGNDETPIDPDNELVNNDLTGFYDGYKTLNKSLTDSIAVSLKVEKISDVKLKIIEIKPFAHEITIDLTGLKFTYDRGLGEDDCGVTRMTGNGSFTGRYLYFIETTTCLKGNAPDEYVDYRVSKK